MTRVVTAAFPRWPPVSVDATPLEHLQWKMSAPRTPPGIHSLVEFEGDVVAAKLRWVGHALLDGEEHMTDAGADLAVAPSFQGRGIGRLINDYEDETDRPRGTVSFEPSPRVEAVIHMHRTGVILPLDVWLRPLRLRSFAGGLWRARNPLAPLTMFARRAGARAGAGRSEIGTEAIVEFDRFDERTDVLWAAAQGDFDFLRVRSAEYLNWRYVDRRSGRRSRLGAFAGDELLGYAVARSAGRVIELSDLLVHPAHPDVGRRLLGRVVEFARDRRATALVAWLPPEHRDEAAFVETGFVRLRSTMPIDHKPPRGAEWPGVLPRFQRADLRRHTTIGDFDFA